MFYMPWEKPSSDSPDQQLQAIVSSCWVGFDFDNTYPIILLHIFVKSASTF